MPSPQCERAIEESLRYGTALLKYISANDVDLTGAHQYGFYLPKQARERFTPYAPIGGRNDDHPATVLWPDGRETASVVKWYGVGTRSEYRLTRFGRDFPYRTAANLGDLLVLIPLTIDRFNAYVLESEDDIEEIEAALGVEVLGSWALYQRGQAPPEAQDECLARRYGEFAAGLHGFPQGKAFSDCALEALLQCVPGFREIVPDDKLMSLVTEEYSLFRQVEAQVWQPQIQGPFDSIDGFIGKAQAILQARKSRAGRSLENHVEYLLTEAHVPFEMRKVVDGTRPDVIIPSKQAYDNPGFPGDRLYMVGVKRTCKDRWRQVAREAPRAQNRYILTLQEGISAAQLDEICAARLTLIVPSDLHAKYPPAYRPRLLTVDAFLNSVAPMTP